MSRRPPSRAALLHRLERDCPAAVRAQRRKEDRLIKMNDLIRNRWESAWVSAILHRQPTQVEDQIIHERAAMRALDAAVCQCGQRVTAAFRGETLMSEGNYLQIGQYRWQVRLDPTMDPYTVRFEGAAQKAIGQQIARAFEVPADLLETDWNSATRWIYDAERSQIILAGRQAGKSAMVRAFHSYYLGQFATRLTLRQHITCITFRSLASVNLSAFLGILRTGGFREAGNLPGQQDGRIVFYSVYTDQFVVILESEVWYDVE